MNAKFAIVAQSTATSQHYMPDTQTAVIWAVEKFGAAYRFNNGGGRRERNSMFMLRRFAHLADGARVSTCKTVCDEMIIVLCRRGNSKAQAKNVVRQWKEFCLSTGGVVETFEQPHQEAKATNRLIHGSGCHDTQILLCAARLATTVMTADHAMASTAIRLGLDVTTPYANVHRARQLVAA